MIHVLKCPEMSELGQVALILLLAFARHLVVTQSCKSHFIYLKDDDGYMIQHDEVPLSQTSVLVCRRWCAGRSDCQAFLLMEEGCTRLACQVGDSTPDYLLLTDPGPVYIPVEGVNTADPDHYLPMDEIVNGVLQGSILGDVHGIDATALSAKRGRGLYTNGINQWVDLGNQRDKCFGNLELCTNGYVVALWLKGHTAVESSPKQYFMTSGGEEEVSMGIALYLRASGLAMDARTSTSRWTRSGGEFTIDTWYHVTLTWTSAGRMWMYLNGCKARKDSGPETEPSNTEPEYNHFVLGAKNYPVVGNNPAHMTMDELQMWDADMGENEVWNIYLKAIHP